MWSNKGTGRPNRGPALGYTAQKISVVPGDWGNATAANTTEFTTDWLEMPQWALIPASNVPWIVKHAGYLMRRSLVSLPDSGGQLRPHSLVHGVEASCFKEQLVVLLSALEFRR